VFERFYRADPSRTRGTGGTGLGLAICQAIVEKAQGEIKISSAPGQGTKVTFRVPLADRAELNGQHVSGHPLVDESASLSRSS
jgi:signal transduction histidine kinase